MVIGYILLIAGLALGLATAGLITYCAYRVGVQIGRRTAMAAYALEAVRAQEQMRAALDDPTVITGGNPWTRHSSRHSA